MKRLLTYGLLLLTILASHFVVSACQDDLPETTEVMMTFTTRAVVTQDKESDVIDVEKMKNLRVIMVREDGTIAYKEVNKIDGSSVTVTFNTPVKTGGENFQFFAIANEDGILPAQNLGSIQSGDIENLKTRVVGSESEFTIINAIPQTKYWTAKVNPYESLSVSQQLDYLVSKISVQFKNETNKAQSLSNIHITGITPNGKGRLFNHPTKDNEGEEIYEEVYVTENSDVTLNNGITFNDVADLLSGESSAIQHYYTYPVDEGNITVDEGNNIYPTLYATWNEQTYTLPLTGFTKLKRNDHLKILITLTDVGIKVTYTIADWEENTTTIGGVNPTLGDNYMVKDWVQGDDVVIGEEPVEPDPGTGDEVTVWDKGPKPLNWEHFAIDNDWFVGAPDGDVQMYVYFSDASQFEVRKNTSGAKYTEVNLNNQGFGKDPYLNSQQLGNLTGKKISIVIPSARRNDPIYISGDITITQITVEK